MKSMKSAAVDALMVRGRRSGPLVAALMPKKIENPTDSELAFSPGIVAALPPKNIDEPHR